MTKPGQSSELQIKKSKYIAKLALKLASILYSQQDYKNALKIINYAYEYSCKSIKETLSSCRKLSNTYSNKPKSPIYSKSEINKILLIERALPTLESLNQFITNGIIKKKIRMRSALGIKAYPE